MREQIFFRVLDRVTDGFVEGQQSRIRRTRHELLEPFSDALRVVGGFVDSLEHKFICARIDGRWLVSVFWPIRKVRTWRVARAIYNWRNRISSECLGT